MFCFVLISIAAYCTNIELKEQGVMVKISTVTNFYAGWSPT